MLRFCLFAGLAVLASSLRDASLDFEPKCSKPGCGQYKKIAKDDQNAAMRDKYGASFVFSQNPRRISLVPSLISFSFPDPRPHPSTPHHTPPTPTTTEAMTETGEQTGQLMSGDPNAPEESAEHANRAGGMPYTANNVAFPSVAHAGPTIVAHQDSHMMGAVAHASVGAGGRGAIGVFLETGAETSKTQRRAFTQNALLSKRQAKCSYPGCGRYKELYDKDPTAAQREKDEVTQETQTQVGNERGAGAMPYTLQTSPFPAGGGPGGDAGGMGGMMAGGPMMAGYTAGMGAKDRAHHATHGHGAVLHARDGHLQSQGLLHFKELHDPVVHTAHVIDGAFLEKAQETQRRSFTRNALLSKRQAKCSYPGCGKYKEIYDKDPGSAQREKDEVTQETQTQVGNERGSGQMPYTLQTSPFPAGGGGGMGGGGMMGGGGGGMGMGGMGMGMAAKDKHRHGGHHHHGDGGHPLHFKETAVARTLLGRAAKPMDSWSKGLKHLSNAMFPRFQRDQARSQFGSKCSYPGCGSGAKFRGELWDEDHLAATRDKMEAVQETNDQIGTRPGAPAWSMTNAPYPAQLAAKDKGKKDHHSLAAKDKKDHHHDVHHAKDEHHSTAAAQHH